MNAKIIKNGNTCTVFRIDNLIIKRYNVKSIWHFIKMQFIKSRGKIRGKFQIHFNYRAFHALNLFFILKKDSFF